nr:hypothetical protein [Chthoniobacterales bacterium]
YSTTFDLLLEYRFGKGSTATQETAATADPKSISERITAPRSARWLDGLGVRVGVRNIFDDAPPFSNSTIGYPAALEDPRQRFVFFDLEKKFW